MWRLTAKNWRNAGIALALGLLLIVLNTQHESLRISVALLADLALLVALKLHVREMEKPGAARVHKPARLTKGG
nr:hypothetical protein [uncultured Enterobacter sp.]